MGSKKSTETAMHMDKFLSWKVDGRVSKLVQATCFKNFLKFEESKHKLHLPLLTAVMSFFDHEHMAFSFPAENSMVDFGLEDILYITGLPIDGEQVSGDESDDPVGTITSLLRISEEEARRLSKGRPTSKAFGISPDLLQIQFEDVPKDIEEKDLEPYFMAYLLFLLGTLVMPNKTKTISPMFLPLLKKAEVNKYAWGAAMLAILKDSLCKWKQTFTGGKTTSLCGFAFALQVFALVRFTVFQQQSPSSFPVMVEWEKVYKPYTKSFANRSLECYQEMLQNMKEDEIKWQPYSKIKLPPEYTSQLRMVFAQVPCICFNTIALNYPGTFFKQLGLEESDIWVPSKIQRKGRSLQLSRHKGKNWRNRTRFYSKMNLAWEDRHNRLVYQRHNEDSDSKSKHPKLTSWDQVSVSIRQISNQKSNIELQAEQKASNEL